ncbi:MAG: tRNA (guanosine(37)-N1)-methyltransferase TrmD [Acidimicrobiia bacterium]|nr:tRNA (guanosine(37)-N1)-methyltransferase TrmD [Acidimicrobiia bacterium]
MKVSVITIFPDFFPGPLDISIVARAIEQDALVVDLVDPREFTDDLHRTVDDAPFGGGAGMVMKIGPIADALESVGPGRRVVFTPAGAPLSQDHLDRWAEEPHLVLLCGRYEGIDQRVADHLIDEEVSLGDFVLAGGEVAALAVIEGVARLLPGVLGNPASTEHESFRDGLLEEPQYTRPADYEGWRVPDVLLSGNHAAVDEWRHEERVRRTKERRPDLLDDSS